MFFEDENENEKTPGPLLLVTRSSESEEEESFDLVWQRKLARRAEEKAKREKKRETGEEVGKTERGERTVAVGSRESETSDADDGERNREAGKQR